VLGCLHRPGIAQIHDGGSTDTGFSPQPLLAMDHRWAQRHHGVNTGTNLWLHSGIVQRYAYHRSHNCEYHREGCRCIVNAPEISTS
jgi:hypothetical protein